MAEQQQDTNAGASPLEGLTEQEADDAIRRLQAKADAQDEHLRAVKEHLKAMKQARKQLRDPDPAGQPDQNGTRANAQSAELSVEGGEV